MAPLHKGQKTQDRGPAAQRSFSSLPLGGDDADVAAAAAEAAASSAAAGQAGGASQRATEALQGLASALSGHMPLSPEDTLLLEGLLKVRCCCLCCTKLPAW